MFQHANRFAIHKHLILLASAWLCVALNAQAQTQPPQRDHVLLITIDDLNDWVGCLSDPADPNRTAGQVVGRGHPQAKTPNLDRLARRGVLFTNAHCQAPICRPSRQSFLSGLRPSTTGVYSNKTQFDAKGTLKPGKDVPWLTRRFEHAGYETFAAGKVIHASNNLLSENPGPSTSQGPYPAQKINVPAEVTKAGVWDWGPFPEMDQFNDWRNARWTIEQINRPVAGDTPRLLALGFYRPHVPLFAPQQYFDQAPDVQDILLGATRDDDLDDLPEIARRMPGRVFFPGVTKWVREDEQRLRSMTRAYLATTTAMDDQLGKVIDALDQSPMADNTWIVVFSDHGWHLGEKNHIAKQTLWERSTHVPLIIVPPKRLADTPRGARCDRPAELIDIYPTLVDAADLAPADSDQHLQGLSLLPWLKDPAAPRDRPALTTLYSHNHSLVDERYRYTRYADGTEELYDRQADPHEFDNLIEKSKNDADLKAAIKRLSMYIPQQQAGEPDRVLAEDNQDAQDELD